MAGEIKFDLSGLQKGLQEMNDKVEQAIRAFAETGASKLEGYARENAKWQNRTGHARQRLRGYVSKVEKGYKIYLAHGVDYGVWLELANEKKYAIIPQSITIVGEKEIMPAFAKLMDKLKG